MARQELYSTAYVRDLERDRQLLITALDRAVKALERDAFLADRLGGPSNQHPAAIAGRKLLDSHLRQTIMKRCNKPAYVYATSNGYRLCRDCFHASDTASPYLWALMSESGPPSSYGRCDKPIETLEQFWHRHGRQYKPA